MDLQTLAKLFRVDETLNDIVWAPRDPETVMQMPNFFRTAAQIETNGGRTIQESAEMTARKFNSSGLVGKRPRWRKSFAKGYLYCQVDSGFVKLSAVANALGIPIDTAQQMVLSGEVKASKTKHGLNPAKRAQERETRRKDNRARYDKATEGAKILSAAVYDHYHSALEGLLTGKQRYTFRQDLFNVARTDLYNGIAQDEVKDNLVRMAQEAIAGAAGAPTGAEAMALTPAGEVVVIRVDAAPFGTVSLEGK